MESIYEKSILLIGGMGIGKTTISKLLSNKLNMKYISTDAYKDIFLENIKEYSFDKQLEIRNNEGYKNEVQYLLPFLNMSFNCLLDNLEEPTIIDVGGLDTYNSSNEILEKIANFKNIFLITSSNIDEILERRNIDKESEIADIYKKTNNNPINYELATKIINIVNKTPEEVTNEIIIFLSNKIIK